MRIQRYTYLTLFLLVFAVGAVAQVDSTRIDSVVIDSTLLKPVTISQPQQARQKQEEEKKPLFKVVPWEFHAPLGAETAATDSTLRWQLWPDWTYRLNREPGVITYRLGTAIRNNGVLRYAHEPRYQQLQWEGISLNDPVTGRLNWSLIPQHKMADVYSQDLGTEYRTTYYTRQYYLNKPLSRLIYSESKFSFRNLEFEVSHNLSQRTNVELSYWDRRAGGEYSNSSVTGRQIYAKISHHLDKQRYLKLNYINNNYDLGQPFGYLMQDMRLFNFNRFNATSNQNSASSQETSSMLALQYYQRKPDSTVSTDNFRAGLFYRGNERLLSYRPDTTQYKIWSAGINAIKWWELGGLSLQASANYKQYFNALDDSSNVRLSNWSLLDAEGRVEVDYTPIIQLYGGGSITYRSDGFQGYRLNASADFSLGGFTLSPGISSGSVIPTPEQLYWNSIEYSGNESLNNEKIQEARAELSYHFTEDTELGIRAQHKDITDGIMVIDSSFTNVTNYASQSATAFFEWNLTHFEFDGSATVHRYTDSFTDPTGSIPMSPDKRLWLKGSAYWKGYLFDRATYIKAGLSGMMAPFRYQADHYNPVLDYWQPVSNDQFLPVFNRLDVDISARVRSIMFILRWENVLDDVNQLGYFESAQYPMSKRRFIFGVRALFRN